MVAFDIMLSTLQPLHCYTWAWGEKLTLNATRLETLE
jgi:hypothetical protein